MAALDRVTAVVGAGVCVVAGDFVAADALALVAVVALGADVAVGTLGVERLADAARCGVAQVGRAGVRIVALFLAARYALAVLAGVGLGAGVAVGARGGVVLAQATLDGVAGVVGARVLVVALLARSRLARATFALVALGTGAAVFTPRAVGRLDATLARIAGVVGTEVAVIADLRSSTQAGAALAEIDQRAGVVVVTALALVELFGVALAGRRRALGLGAEPIGALVADHDVGLVDDAQPCLDLAYLGPTQVGLLATIEAVVVDRAFAGAQPLALALVVARRGRRALVAIVAWLVDLSAGVVAAARGGVAVIDGAGVVIIALGGDVEERPAAILKQTLVLNLIFSVFHQL